MYRIMNFWHTCYKLFEKPIPDEITVNSPKIFVDLIYRTQWTAQPTNGKIDRMAMFYRFNDKIAQINLVPRHKSTDRKGDTDEYEQVDGKTC